jgi:hypothetical protein
MTFADLVARAIHARLIDEADLRTPLRIFMYSFGRRASGWARLFGPLRAEDSTMSCESDAI